MGKLRRERTENVLVAIILFVALLIWGFPGTYPLVLFRSFAVHFLFLCIALVLWLLIRKKWLAATLVVIPIFLVQSFLPAILSLERETPEKSPELRIAHFNIFKPNRAYEQATDRIKRCNADLITIQEVDDRWARILRNKLGKTYPHHELVPMEDDYGVAVFSRLPFENIRVSDPDRYPAILGTLKLKGKNISFYTTHTKAPVLPWGFHLRDRQLERASSRIEELPSPRFLMGDLNAVPWDGKLLKLKEHSGLKGSRKGYSATFPAWMGPLGIPIDHILHSQEVECLEFRTVRGTNSDHLGVVGDYRFR